MKKAFEKIKDLVSRATKKVGGFRKTCKSLGRGCFVTGTLVLMANGTLLPIEQVKAGDRVQSAIVAPVKSVQEKKGSFEVSGTSKRWYEGAVHAILIGKKRESATWLKGTPEHPVWLPRERVWKPLAELRTGDLLSGREGLLRVFGHRVSFGRARVFNLRVPGANAYRVSRWGGLVHNNYDDLVAAAKKKYPRKAGKIERHHVTPKYLGGSPKGPTVPIDAAYHQKITNAFRELHPYGLPKPSPERLEEIKQQVYERFPLPGGK